MGIGMALECRAVIGEKSGQPWVWLRVVTMDYDAWIVEGFADYLTPGGQAVRACHARSKAGETYRASGAGWGSIKLDPLAVGTCWAAAMAAARRIA